MIQDADNTRQTKHKWLIVSEAILILFIIFVFVLSAVQGIHLILDDARGGGYLPDEPRNVFLFWSFITMSVSGLGLIFILLLKLQNLKKSNRDRKEAQKENEELQKQFFQAQKMEAIGRLAGGIAHDFNNILASMIGYTEFLLEDLDKTSEQHGFSRSIMSGAQQAKQLVAQILAFSRKQETARAAVDLSDVVQESCAILRSSVPSTVKLQTILHSEQSLIAANRTQISQALMNLCVNAKDAMDDKGVLRVGVDYCEARDIPYRNMMAEKLPPSDQLLLLVFEEIEQKNIAYMGQFERGRDYVCLSVEDSGDGIPKDILEHAFEPFFTTKETGKGTGLGLSSVHGIIAVHQGAMVVHSAKGRGTKFELYFPVIEKDSVLPEDAADLTEKISGSGNILLVEDQNNVREMMTHMISRLGYDPHACEDALDAIDLLREKPGYFDLVLTDHSMPVMTGIEMASEIYLDFPELPVVLMSGHNLGALEDIVAECPSIKGYIRKPIDGLSLSKCLHDVMTDYVWKEKTVIPAAKRKLC